MDINIFNIVVIVGIGEYIPVSYYLLYITCNCKILVSITNGLKGTGVSVVWVSVGVWGKCAVRGNVCVVNDAGRI